MQTLVQVVHHPAPPVRSVRRDVPIDLDTIIAKCLEKDPNKRYESAEKLAQELDAFLEGRPIEARPRSVVIKAWHWMEGVPLVGALTGRRVLHSSELHRRFQAAMLLLMLLMPILSAGAILAWQRHKQSMPTSVRVAGGVKDGIYQQVSMELGRRVQAAQDVEFEVVPSGGSAENRDRLVAGQVDIAPMQYTAIPGSPLFLVAPLFHELLYVLARGDTTIATMEDLQGRRVAVGPLGSGSRKTSELVLDSMDLSAEVERVVIDWEDLLSENPPEAAMICIGRGSVLVRQLIEVHQWRLIPIPSGVKISMEHRALDAMTIEMSEFPTRLMKQDIPTVGTTAFLAAREDTPSELVVAFLQALYEDPPPCQNLIPRDQVVEWPAKAFHPAARRFLKLSQQ
jgi:TRAP transporter TAXI family solute receptor